MRCCTLACTWYRVSVNENGTCCSQYGKSKAVGENHVEDLTSAVLWSGQASRFAKHDMYSGQIWEWKAIFAMQMFMSCDNLKLCKCGGNTGRIFLVKVNITKWNFSSQTEDQRVKGAVWNVDQSLLVHQNSCSALRQHTIEILLMKRGGE